MDPSNIDFDPSLGGVFRDISRAIADYALPDADLGVDRTFATLSNEVYKDPDQRNNVGDYAEDKEFSQPGSTVFIHSSGEPVIVFRGTKTADDISADIDILLGRRRHQRFNEALDLEEKVRKKYGKSPTVTGHSLGGTLANHVALNRRNRAIIFNPGSSPFMNETVAPSTRVYRRKSDIISGGFGGGRGSVFGSLLNHSLKNILR